MRGWITTQDNWSGNARWRKIEGDRIGAGGDGTRAHGHNRALQIDVFDLANVQFGARAKGAEWAKPHCLDRSILK